METVPISLGIAVTVLTPEVRSACTQFLVAPGLWNRKITPASKRSPTLLQGRHTQKAGSEAVCPSAPFRDIINDFKLQLLL